MGHPQKMDDLELIKQKINVVDLISEYLPLKKAGVNYKSPCPFHNEKTPSFVVSPDRGIWHCFGCQKGGDIFKFVMEKEGLSFPEAIETLAAKAGVTLSKSNKPTKDSKTKLYEAHLKSAEFFHYILIKHDLGQKGLEYLKKRGLTDETINVFNLGYAPNSWQSLTDFLIKRGYLLSDLIQAGLTVQSNRGGYDRFRGRVIFPLIDIKNQVIGFAGRILGSGEPKYINSPQTDIFDKSHYLFGLNLTKGDIRQKKEAILVEGEMDMIMSFQAGVKNVVASKGTALTQGQVELIKKYTDTISLCFDADLAGDSAARRGIELAEKAGLTIKIIQLSGGKDPAEISLKDPKVWELAVHQAIPVYDYYLNTISSRYDLKTAEGKKKAGAELMPIMAKIPDTFKFEHYLQKLAALLSTSEDILRKEIKKPNIQITPTYQAVLKQTDSGPKVSFRPRRELLEEYLLALLLRIPINLTYVPNFPETLFLNENHRSLYVLLVVYLDSISFKAKAFQSLEFVKTLPEELIPIVDQLYLVEIDDKLTTSKSWQEEISKIVVELKRALIKATLEKLSSEIKSAQAFGKMEALETLNKRFRDLSVKLKNL